MDKKIAVIAKLSPAELKKYFEAEDLQVLHKMKLHIDDIYEYGEVPLEDEQYDLLVDIIKKKDPKYKPPIGFKIREDDNRVKVPYHMGSMDKIRPHVPEEVNFFKTWLKEYENDDYLIEDKLDGVSCLIVVKNGKYTLYKRPGRDGFGADISYFLPYFSSIPKNLKNIVVRGELIVRKDIFEKKYRRQKCKDDGYRTPRGMVAGVTGAKKVQEGLKDIDFVAYEKIYEDGVVGLKPTDQLAELQKLGFLTVRREIVDEISIDILSELLVKFRQESPYEIDGVIVQPDAPYERNLDGNPAYTFAFKMRRGEAVVNGNVKHVLWKVSRRGKLKPRIEMDPPVIIDDYENTFATAFNAKYVVDNKLGPGAIVQVTRSGDVIPYIVKVVKGDKEPQMPEEKYFWDKNGTDIYGEGQKNEKCIMIIHHFFTATRIKHLGESTVQKLYEHGYDNLFKLLMATKKDFEQLEGFGTGLAAKVYDSIHSTLDKGVTIPELLDGSGIFGEGIGPKLVTNLLSNWPNMFTEYKDMDKLKILHKVMRFADFGPNRSQKIADNMAWADIFLQAMALFATIKKVEIVNTNLKGMVFVFSGFRDKDLEEQVVARGGKVTGSVSKKITALVVASKAGKPTGKRKKAADLGVPEYEKQEFIAKYIG